MVQTKHFVTHYRYPYESKSIDEQINQFLQIASNIEVIDIKFSVEAELREYHALLIYKEQL